MNVDRLAPARVAAIVWLAILLVVPTARAAAGSPRKLNGPLAPGGRVAFGFQVSPDGRRVVYRADQETAGMLELFSVPPGGGDPVKLNGPLPAGGGVTTFSISPDSRWVLYLAPKPGGGTGVFRVPLEGGDSVELQGPPGGGVTGFALTPDSVYLVYERLTGPSSGRVRELFSEPLAGTGPLLALTGPVFLGGSFFSGFQVSPDGHLLYDGRVGPHQALYLTTVTGGPTVVIHPGDAPLNRFTFTPDGARVLYLVRFNDVLSVPVAGGTPVLLGLAFLPSLLVSPDSSTVLFFNEHLDSAPVAGGATVRLAERPQIGSAVISPDSSRVAYQANHDPADSRNEVYVVPITGGPPLRLSPPSPSFSGGPREMAITADSSRVVFADKELFSVPLAGGGAVQVSHLLPGFERVRDFRITPDGGTAVYLAADANPSVPELFQAPVAGGAHAKLNGPLTVGGRIQSFAVTADGRHVIYHADQDTLGVPELYAADLGAGCSVTVRPMSQRDPRWSCDHYDHCPVTACTQADHGECTIGDLGCALASLAMALDFVGIATDPAALNQFMKAHADNFVSHGVHFDNTIRDVSQAQTDPTLRLLKLNTFGGRKSSLLDPFGAEKVLEDALCAPTPHPVIVKVPNSSGALGHYLLVTGRKVGPGGGVSYLVTDPYPRAVPRTTLDEYRNAQGVPEFETVGAVMDPPGDISGLSFAVADEVELLVTDPQGRRSGIDPAGGERLQEIPDSSHGLDGVEDEESGDQPFGLAHVVSVFQPAAGAYEARLTGVRPGPFTLAVRVFSQDGSPQPPLSLPGIAGEGSVSTFALELTTAPGEASRLVRAATFASTLEDIGSAEAQGLIQPQGIARALAAKVEAAAEAARRGRTEASRNLLEAFGAQVRAQSPGHVSPLAAQVLLEDADALVAGMAGGS